MFVAGAYHFRRSTLGYAPALPAKIRLGWKGLPGTNSLSQKSVNYGSKISYSSGPRTIKSVTVIVIVALSQVKVFATEIHFHPSLIFVGKATSLPSKWNPIRGSYLAGS